jgi:hypothetical protein
VREEKQLTETGKYLIDFDGSIQFLGSWMSSAGFSFSEAGRIILSFDQNKNDNIQKTYNNGTAEQ